jgi:hypothetical protein
MLNNRISGLKHILLAIIKFYRCVFSSCAAPCCRFYPTCSYYAEQALMQHGVKVGIQLTLKRLSKCHPWGSSGIDFVPERLCPQKTAHPE